MSWINSIRPMTRKITHKFSPLHHFTSFFSFSFLPIAWAQLKFIKKRSNSHIPNFFLFFLYARFWRMYVVSGEIFLVKRWASHSGMLINDRVWLFYERKILCLSFHLTGNENVSCQHWKIRENFRCRQRVLLSMFFFSELLPYAFGHEANILPKEKWIKLIIFWNFWNK